MLTLLCHGNVSHSSAKRLCHSVIYAFLLLDYWFIKIINCDSSIDTLCLKRTFDWDRVDLVVFFLMRILRSPYLACQRWISFRKAFRSICSTQEIKKESNSSCDLFFVKQWLHLAIPHDLSIFSVFIYRFIGVIINNRYTRHNYKNICAVSSLILCRSFGQCLKIWASNGHKLSANWNFP